MLLHHVERDRSPSPLPFLHLVLSGGAKAHTVKLRDEHLGAVVRRLRTTDRQSQSKTLPYVIREAKTGNLNELKTDYFRL